MVDVIFYLNKIGTQNIIEGYKHIMNAPNIGEHIVVNDNCYKIIDRVFDFDGNTIHIVVEICRRRFMK